MSEQLLNIKFVREVEKYPELYNYNLPSYSRRDLVDHAWNNVSSEVNMTVPECKDRWKNLRTVYARKLRQTMTESNYDRRKRAYYLADAMEFALPFIKNAMRPKKDPKSEVEILWHFDSDSESSPLETVSATPLQETSKSINSRKRSMMEEQQPTSQKPVTKPETETRDSSGAKMVKVDDVPCANCHEGERKEALKMFLLSLMPELVQFNDHQIGLFKRRIFGLMDEISGNH